MLLSFEMVQAFKAIEGLILYDNINKKDEDFDPDESDALLNAHNNSVRH